MQTEGQLPNIITKQSTPPSRNSGESISSTSTHYNSRSMNAQLAGVQKTVACLKNQQQARDKKKLVTASRSRIAPTAPTDVMASSPTTDGDLSAALAASTQFSSVEMSAPVNSIDIPLPSIPAAKFEEHTTLLHKPNIVLEPETVPHTKASATMKTPHGNSQAVDTPELHLPKSAVHVRPAHLMSRTFN